MKKSKIYFIAPIIVLGAFFAYYWNFRSDYDAKQAIVLQAEKQRKIDKLNAEALMRQRAMQDAIDAQKQRKAERIAREEKERKQKEDKENARLEAEKADQEAQKLQRQAEKLEKDVATAKEEITKIEAEKKFADEELVFLKDYTAQAVANQSKLADVLTKIRAADLANEKAAAAAAAAAKNK
jgi:preprotein translocase subunit SecF